MRSKKVELLAPAGNKEAFYGAIHAGADAVYLGGNRFGARAYAENFTEEDLLSCIRYAHIFGRKVYLTVNTLVKENEFDELYDYIKPFYEAGLDAVIVQDIGVFSYIKDHFPDMELHVSTQMTITGKYGAALLKEMGASRVVPARELSLEEIEILKTETGIEVETFIHGAMCYCYSGQCLFSSILGGRSGNRGRCAQPCRLPYTVTTGKDTSPEGYPLSLKDMCTIEHIPELIGAGIDSFKIEGRMKKAEYAAGVTAIYRKYIDKFTASCNKEFKVSEKDLRTLSRLYIRSERHDGYYYKHNGKDMVTLNSPAYSGSDDAILSDIRSRYLDKILKQDVSVYGYFQVGETAVVTYLVGDISITVYGDTVQQASSQPITHENIEKQLSKLGDTAFEVTEAFITVSDNAFYSLKSLNELRRQAVSKLEELLINSHGLAVKRSALPKQDEKRSKSIPIVKNNKIHVSVRTLHQLRVILKNCENNQVSRIYIDGDLMYTETESVNNLIASHKDTEFIIELPRILRKRDVSYLKHLFEVYTIDGFSISSIEALGFLKAQNYQGKIYAAPGFYIWNHKTFHTFKNSIHGFCMPYELNANEQKVLLKSLSCNETPINCEKVFYGRIPMMVTANCIAQTTDTCKKGTHQTVVQLNDRYQKSLPVILHCTHCMNTIYNSVPLSLHTEWKKWQDYTDMRLDFTVEDIQETREIFDFFKAIYNGTGVQSSDSFTFGEYTTGHEKRGAE